MAGGPVNLTQNYDGSQRSYSPVSGSNSPGDGNASVLSDLWSNSKEWAGSISDVDDRTLTQSKYDFTRRVFPSDLEHADTYNGHYVVININAQTNSSYSRINGTTVFSPMSGELSKTDALRFKIDNSFTNASGTTLGQNFTSRPRFTRRITESIALYMPNGELTFTDLHQYDDISMSKFAGSFAGGTAKLAGSAIGGIIGSFNSGLGKAITGGVGGMVDALQNNIGAVSQIAGTPINPKVEVLFSSTYQREFSFDFLFAPANEKESIALEQIIRTIRFHAHPELKPGTLDSFFYVPPSEFDLTFFYRGNENTKIPRVNTCVLTRCDVSYAPSGVYSTFHNGHPVTVRMMLGFRETETMHKLRVLQGF